MLNFDFLEKGPRLVSPPYFVDDFSRKNVSHAIFPNFQIPLTKFHCLIALTLLYFTLPYFTKS